MMELHPFKAPFTTSRWTPAGQFTALPHYSSTFFRVLQLLLLLLDVTTWSLPLILSFLDPLHRVLCLDMSTIFRSFVAPLFSRHRWFRLIFDFLCGSALPPRGQCLRTIRRQFLSVTACWSHWSPLICTPGVYKGLSTFHADKALRSHRIYSCLRSCPSFLQFSWHIVSTDPLLPPLMCNSFDIEHRHIAQGEGLRSSTRSNHQSSHTCIAPLYNTRITPHSQSTSEKAHSFATKFPQHVWRASWSSRRPLRHRR